MRINFAGDDAAGLAVANTYRNEQAILNQGIRNANDGLSDLQIKDGALGQHLRRCSTGSRRWRRRRRRRSNGADISKLSDEYAAMSRRNRP